VQPVANAAGAEELEATWWGLGNGVEGPRPWLEGEMCGPADTCGLLEALLHQGWRRLLHVVAPLACCPSRFLPFKTLSTWLALKWRPRITIGGATKYTLKCRLKSCGLPVESWTVIATAALLQLFRPVPGSAAVARPAGRRQ
jgi:hypothetical protein